MSERKWIEKAKTTVPVVTQLASRDIKNDEIVQLLSLELAEKITSKKDLSVLCDLFTALDWKYEHQNMPFFQGFFWALERLFFVLKSYPYSEEETKVWSEKKEKLLGTK